MDPTPARSAHYAFQELADGLWAGVAVRGGQAVSNAGVLDLGGEVLVFDPGLTRTSARDLIALSELRLKRAPSIAANSHWHLDHSLGNQAFEGLPIWATRRTREIMLERQDETRAELSREALEKDVRELTAMRDSAPNDGARRDAELFLGMNLAILESLDGLRVVLPNRSFDTRLHLPGGRGAQLISFGSGHTEADALLFVPEERLLYTGDLACVGLQPSLGSGDPEHWLTVLDEMERLGAERIVPGHGPVSGPDGARETRDYVSAVLEAARAPETATLPVALRTWEGSLGLKTNVHYTRKWLQRDRAP
jgi:cyclase